MNADKLLDAIGMVDDDLLEPERKRKIIPFRRKVAVLIAAAMILLLSVSVAAADGDLRQWGQEVQQNVQELAGSVENIFLKVFQIETPDDPPESTLGPKYTETTGMPGETTKPTAPTGPLLEFVNMVDIEGVVHAYYIAGTGFQTAFEGGFYTWLDREEDQPPEESTFWEITREGIVDVGKTRVDFILNHGNKDFRILFDYAQLAGKLCIKVWVQGLSEDPYGNGWAAHAIGNRTDMVLLTIPTPKDQDYTSDIFLLDLQTMEVTNLLEGISAESIVIYAAWPTSDLRFLLMLGYDPTDLNETYWICDLEGKTITGLEAWTGCDAVTQPYLLDDRTLVVHEYLGDGRITVARYDIPTMERTVIVEDVPRDGKTGYRDIYSMGAGGYHGLLFEEDGNVWLIDLRTGQRQSLEGLDMSAYRIESPDGQMILFAYQKKAADEETSFCYPKIGLLNSETGEMLMLTREISGNAEYCKGFVDSNTIIIESRKDENGDYYLYVYEFTR